MSARGVRAGPGVFLLLRRLRAPLIVLLLVYAIAVIGFTLVPGRDPAGEPWKMGFFHAFYFVSFLGTTIGLGEIPYPFSDAQRLWATVSIYSTVIAWLYGIGALLATLQDPLFRRVVHESRFSRTVNRIREPFVIVCGYGDAGALVTRELIEDGIRVVVVEKDADRAQLVEVDDLTTNVPALHAAAVDPDVLLQAGVNKPWCIATLALTGDDAANLTVALNARLLAPGIETVCVAHHHEHQAAMARVGAGHIINPGDSFAERLAEAITRPSLRIIYDSLTAQSMTPASTPRRVPGGHWIVCGYGRFGRTVSRHLREAGVAVTVVADQGHAGDCEGAVTGSPLDARVLRAAGVAQADGIVVTLADDTLTLAVTMLARELNPAIFSVVRQSEKRNTPLFEALSPEMAIVAGDVVGAEVLRIIRAPQLSYFLRLARREAEPWAAELLHRLQAAIGDNVPDSWSQRFDARSAPGVATVLAAGTTLRVADLLLARDNGDPWMQAVPLLLQRESGKVLLPDDDERILIGDQLLLCGTPQARSSLFWNLHDPDALRASAARRAPEATTVIGEYPGGAGARNV
jgi:Trk K+ transport system NAD-binding subunit